eukprot:TRINITY_DN7412_c0_g1_i6.p1 TRINITY_DN7412_c0_g1~~TRINITY_DN7412_c0_g1_i6.p1  ORF type:complete len:928 (+),score=122.83 TRINITY_DN7412_c0_g1_i6:1650-4433(+)
MTPNSIYTFTVILIDMLSRSASASHILHIQNVEVPLIYLPLGTGVNFPHDSGIRVSPIIQMSDCRAQSPLLFEWEIKDTSEPQRRSIIFQSRTLDVSPLSLTIGHHYNASFTACYTQEDTTSGCARATFLFSIMNPGLKCKLSGPSHQVVSRNEIVVVEVMLPSSTLLDSGSPDLVEFQWNCTDISTNRTCIAQDKMLLEFENSSRIEFEAISPIDATNVMYNISVSISHKSSSVRNFCHKTLSIIDTSPLLRGIEYPSDRPLKIHEPITFHAILNTVLLNSSIPYKMKWNVLAGASDLGQIGVSEEGVETQFLSIEPGSLYPNQVYCFQACIYIPWSECLNATIQTEEIPRGGGVYVDYENRDSIPPWAEFNVWTTNWIVDKQNLPLTFAFGYKTGPDEPETLNTGFGILPKTRLIAPHGSYATNSDDVRGIWVYAYVRDRLGNEAKTSIFVRITHFLLNINAYSQLLPSLAINRTLISTEFRDFETILQLGIATMSGINGWKKMENSTFQYSIDEMTIRAREITASALLDAFSTTSILSAIEVRAVVHQIESLIDTSRPSESLIKNSSSLLNSLTRKTSSIALSRADMNDVLDLADALVLQASMSHLFPMNLLQAEIAQLSVQSLLNIITNVASGMACEQVTSANSTFFEVISTRTCKPGRVSIAQTAPTSNPRLSITVEESWGDSHVNIVESLTPTRPPVLNQRLISKIVAVEVRRRDLTVIHVENATHPILIYIPIEESRDANLNANPRNCHFYDTLQARWSQEGCNTTYRDAQVLCECNHLTDFAFVQSDNNQDGADQDNSIEELPGQLSGLTTPVLVSVIVLTIVSVTLASIYYARWHRRSTTRSMSVLSRDGLQERVSWETPKVVRKSNFVEDAEQLDVIIKESLTPSIVAAQESNAEPRPCYAVEASEIPPDCIVVEDI